MGVRGLTTPHLLRFEGVIVLRLRLRSALPLKGAFKEKCMRPSKRFSVHKGRSARKFRRHAGRTKAVNLSGPMRGGIRL